MSVAEHLGIRPEDVALDDEAYRRIVDSIEWSRITPDDWSLRSRGGFTYYKLQRDRDERGHASGWIVIRVRRGQYELVGHDTKLAEAKKKAERHFVHDRADQTRLDRIAYEAGGDTAAAIANLERRVAELENRNAAPVPPGQIPSPS